MKTIKAGDIFYVGTNAELLNKLLGTHYKAWMKSCILLSDDEMIWMPRLDSAVRAGWKNYMLNGKIIEEYVGGRPYPDNIYLGFEVRRRAVFEKCDWGKYFIFRGVFEIEQGYTLARRTLCLIKDEIDL